MSVNSLQSFFPATALPPAMASPAPGTLNKSGSTSAFDSLLNSLAAEGSPSNRSGKQAVAAEMFRIEMMQQSLTLSGDGAVSSPGPLTDLEALLSGPANFDPRNPFSRQSVTAPAAPAPDHAGAAQASNDLTSIGTTAAQYLGTPYRFGGESADGIDCSSFVQKVFKEHQINLPRTAREQSKVGTDVAQGDLRKGDLVFFHTYASYPSHVGIYLGDGKMIHASSGKGEVTVSDLNSNYYQSRFLGAKRMG